MKKLRYYFKKYSLPIIRFLHRLEGSINSRKAILLKLPGSRKVQPLVSRYRLVFSMVLAIAICLLLTVFSVLLYVITGTSKLDLSRPGYEEVRKQVTRTSPDESSFESNGALDTKIIGDYLEKYKKQTQTLSKYDTFNPHLLDDAPLGLASTVIGPTDGANTSP